MKIFTNLLLILMLSIVPLMAQSVSIGKLPTNVTLSSDKMISAPVSHVEQWEPKVSPLLKMHLVSLKKEMQKESFSAANFVNNSKLISLYKSNSNEVFSQVLIQTKDMIGTKEYIKSIGGYVQTEIGDILTAELPLLNIDNLATREGISYIDCSFIRAPYMDVSRVECRVDAVHTGNGLPRGFKGNGVIVGVIDSGIDWKHNDFKNSSGSRIDYLWDMSGSSNPPSGYNYGREYTKSQIDAGNCQEVDDISGHGHGTHVTSTAAGNGNAIGNYVGIAPDSRIIFVKGFRNGPGFADGDVLNGCNYIFNKAQSLNKASVINMSLGGHYGPHDGTSLYEQGLGNLTGNGKIIVVSAGNEGDSYSHLSYTTGGTNTNEARQSFWLVDEGTNVSVTDMWYNAPGQMAVGIAAYDASLQLIGYTNPILPGSKIEDLAFTVQGFTYGYVTVDASVSSDPNNGARRVLLAIDSHNGQVGIRNCYWTIYTYGSGTFDAWCFTGGHFSTDNNPPQYYPGDNNKTVGMPSTSKKVLSIGSHVTKNQWTDMDGVLRQQPGNPTIGSKSSFSSMGPSRDLRIKPDLTAPGEVIIAALSGDLPIGANGIPRTDIVVGGKHQKMQGTSMASPHVTGVVALMLERNRNLDYQQVFNLLTANTKKDAYTGTTTNNSFGAGKLDALKTMQNTPVGTDVEITEELPMDYSLMQNFPNPFNPSTVISYQLPVNSFVSLKVFDILGNEVANLVNSEQSAGSYEVTFEAGKLSSGVYLYQLRAGEFVSSKKLMLMK